MDVERSRASAAEADEATARGDELGPLHGLPHAFKDTHEVAGWTTTFGSPLRETHVPKCDELIAERIRKAGVVVIGKTNVPEWAAGSHTFNPIFGTTRNPYDLSRSAGGSSGGAAAALASGMVPLADGSDMGCRSQYAHPRRGARPAAEAGRRAAGALWWRSASDP